MKKRDITVGVSLLCDLLQQERDRCKKDVCDACGGRALQWEQRVVGPNDAGNYVHLYRGQPQRSMLCVASSIFARDRFDKAHNSNNARADALAEKARANL